MGKITESLVRKRAEHNEGMVSTLEELALHQENLEKIELLGQLCPHLKILYLQSNLIGKIQNLHKLKDGQDIKPSEQIAAKQVVHDLEAQLQHELRTEGIDPDKAAEVEDDSIYDENGEVKETGYVDEKGEVRRPWCPATRILDHREQEQLNREAEEKKKPKDSDLHKTNNKQPRHETFPEIKEGEKVYQKNEGKWDFTLQESEDGTSVVLDVDVGKYLDSSLIQADVQPSYVRLLIKGRLLQLLLPCEVSPDASQAQRSKLTGHLVVTMPKEDPTKATLDVQFIRPEAGTTGVASGQNHQRSSSATQAGQSDRATASGGDVLKPRNSNTSRTGKTQLTSIHNIVKRADDTGEFIIKELRKAAIVEALGDDDDDIPSL